MENNFIEQPETEPENNTENSNGSIFGKFKDAITLLDAYNNLESEFTRKSQKLAELQKENEKNAIFSENDDFENILKDQDNKDKYKKEITEIIDSENELKNLPNKNYLAFKIIKLAESKTADKLNDQEFIDKYLSENTAVKNKIISEYLSTLNDISSVPTVLSGNSQSIHFAPNSNSPKTIREAGEIFSKMLK